MKYFLYDVETTGFTRRDEVIQFSGYLLDDNLRNEHIINFYAYTQIESNPDALKVHHLDKKLLWGTAYGRSSACFLKTTRITLKAFLLETLCICSAFLGVLWGFIAHFR